MARLRFLLPCNRAFFKRKLRVALGLTDDLRLKANAMAHSIESLLKRRGAWLKGNGGDRGLAEARSGLTRRIAEHYPVFEQLRDHVLHGGAPLEQDDHRDLARDLVSHMEDLGLVTCETTGKAIPHLSGKKFMSGGWLEELAFLAAVEAGAHEALFGQNVGWSAHGYSGENEIDLIVRRDETLGFVSCKALRSMLNVEDRKQRNRLMDAIHEADNLADHFGQPGERVAVLVTTDLHDEMRGVPRYAALMGKAAVLDVRIIPLEELGWERLVTAIGDLWHER
jgi:hypothetical protein